MALIGIDVGGTFTDGVLFDGKSVIKDIKELTDNNDLKATLLTVLDELLKDISNSKIQRIVLSTTLITNTLATESGDKVALLLIPGPGLPFSAFNIFPDTYFLKGSIDFRGRELEPIDPDQVNRALDIISSNSITKLAIVGKFSNRNDLQEKQVGAIVKARFPDMQIALGSETAGQLNFRRRIVTTYYSIMTSSIWTDFVADLRDALAERNISAPIDILKADGGTMTINASLSKPCETIFSGPAASTMGAMAISKDSVNAVVLDIGGTTSDISLLIDGKPLYASRGASINGYFSHINAFSVRSVALGGDSPIYCQNDMLEIGSNRLDVAACFGGFQPTVTDVFNCKYNLGLGEEKISREKLSIIAMELGISLEKLCEQAEEIVLTRLQSNIQSMFKEWENEPAYRVWEVVNSRRFKVDKIIGIGAAAQVIVPVLAERMQVHFLIHRYSPVANALGACVARPTLALNFHIDTQDGYYTADHEGISGKVDKGRSYQIKDARDLAKRHLEELAVRENMAGYASEAEFYREEQFNVIRGYSTSGKIFEVGIQISPGFIKEYEGVSL